MSLLYVMQYYSLPWICFQQNACESRHSNINYEKEAPWSEKYATISKIYHWIITFCDEFALVNDDMKKSMLSSYFGWETINCLAHISPKIHMHTWHQVGDKCLDNYVVFCVHAQQTFTFGSLFKFICLQ